MKKSTKRFYPSNNLWSKKQHLKNKGYYTHPKKQLINAGWKTVYFKTSKPHACDPGYTQADLPGSGSPGFCLFYARGCCGFGHKCRSWDDLSVFLGDGWVNEEELMMDDVFGGVKCEETAHSEAVS